jgi:hypothetical protein
VGIVKSRGILDECFCYKSLTGGAVATYAVAAASLSCPLAGAVFVIGATTVSGMIGSQLGSGYGGDFEQTIEYYCSDRGHVQFKRAVSDNAKYHAFGDSDLKWKGSLE